jgi:hypothetical protein
MDTLPVDSTPTYTEKDFAKQMEVVKRHAGNNFLQVRYDHLQYLNGDGNSAVIFSHLLNLLRMKWGNRNDRKKLIHEQMWFQCPHKSIQEKLGMTWDKVDRVIKALSDKTLLETKHGHRNKLWVLVRTDTLKKLEEAAVDADGFEEDDESSETGKPSNRETQLQGNPPLRNGETLSLETGKPSNRETQYLTKNGCNNGVSNGIENPPNKPTNKLLKETCPSHSENTEEPPLQKKTKSVEQQKEWCKEWSTKLHQSLRDLDVPMKASSVQGRTDKMYILYKQLGTPPQAEDRIEICVNFYVSNYEQRSHLKLPDITSVAHFCNEAIFTWIERIAKEVLI